MFNFGIVAFRKSEIDNSKMKVKKSKGKKASKSAVEGDSMKNLSKEAPWKKVKLSGNLLSDDGGLGLEGLLGLEVLENPHKAVKVTREKFVKVKSIKVPMAEENSEDSDAERSSKNQRKKKKKLLKKAKEKAKEKAAAKAKSNEPGRFVRPPRDDDALDKESKTDENGNTNKKKKKKKSKKQKQTKPDDGADSNEAALTINDLVVRILSLF